MTTQERDYDDILRRALRAAAESVEPAADGLELIRRRVSQPRHSSFMLTEFLDWFRPILIWLESAATAARFALDRMELPARSEQVLDRLRPGLVRLRPLFAWVPPLLAAMGWKAQPQRQHAAHRTQPPPTGLRGTFTRLGPAASWLRPVLAVAGAVAIVVAGVFALGQAQQLITPTNQVTHPGVSQHKASPPPTRPNAVVPPIWVNQSATPTSTADSSPGASTVNSCPPTTPKASASAVAPASSPPPTPTPTPTPSVSPSDSPSPTVSPTDTTGASKGAPEVSSLRAKRIPVPCPGRSTPAG